MCILNSKLGGILDFPNVSVRGKQSLHKLVDSDAVQD